MKRAVKRDPQELEYLRAEFFNYLKFLKEEGYPVPADVKGLDKAYLQFASFAKVRGNTMMAQQNRENAIRRAAGVMDFDPDDQDEREILLGVLAYKLFPPLEDRKKPGPDFINSLRRLSVHVEELKKRSLFHADSKKRMGELLFDNFPGKNRLYHGFPGYQSRAAARKLIGKVFELHDEQRLNDFRQFQANRRQNNADK
jgi:hypothetical protein